MPSANDSVPSAGSKIYLSPPDMGQAERDAVMRAFDSNWITTLGPEVDAFESELAGFVGAASAAAFSSGTAALHLALLLAGVERGDEVWTSTLTFAAPANAITYTGATPRFFDSERETWNIDPDLLQSELERVAAGKSDAAGTPARLPKAIVAVDLYGQAAQLDRIAALCEEYGVVLIEDAAEALGATWQGRHAGTYGRYGVYSFNGNKIITTSGGGMLVGKPEDMARARYLGSQARLPALHYEHDEVGYNYRLSNILAAIGRAQLERLPGIIERCRSIRDTYRAELSESEPGGVVGVGFMPWDLRGVPNGWLTLITLSPELRAAGVTPHAVSRSLAESDIEARPSWKPMHRQRVFADAPSVGGAVADELFESGVCLPSGSNLTESDQDRVISALRKVLSVR